MWSLGAIGISIISVIVGTLLALRSSVALTPSMKMKWGIRKEDKTGEFSNSYRLDMPVLISEEKVVAFTDFLETNIRRRILSLGSDLSYSVNTPTYIRRGWNEDQPSLVMIHRGGTKFDVSKTEMKIEKMDEGLYGLVLISVGPVNSVKQVGDLVRRILMEWSHHTGQIHEEMKHLDLTG